MIEQPSTGTMSSFDVTHLDNGKTYARPAILLNPHRSITSQKPCHQDSAVEAFHRQLPSYGETQLHSLPAVATELGFAHVFLKDESTRFGLPSFKILGASWAIHKALCLELGLPASTSLQEVKIALKTPQRSDKVRLVTCTEGNWGRATSRMAKYYDVPCTIYVPGFMNEYTRSLIKNEGADLRVLDDGSYDDAIAAVQQDATETGALMVMDTSWDGYEEVPGWVTEGYETMMAEVDRQVAKATGGVDDLRMLAVASVGVGSWAHAVVKHYTALSPENQVVTVEPVAAPSFKESLHCGKITPIVTGDTINNGMNCGTTSKIAWPVLNSGVFAAVTVEDIESHKCVRELQAQGVNAGPCGASTLAALRKLCQGTEAVSRAKRADMIVVLFSTEGMREYEEPAK